MTTSNDSSDLALRFTEQELAMLGKTADGLSAYMGKAVLAEVGMDDDAEWVIFAIPIGVDETPDDSAMHVQMGGPDARFVGNRGGLDLDTEVYDCQYLWAIQITEDPEARFVRLDDQGEEFDFSNDLAELLPFDLTDEALPDPDLELQEDLGEDDEDDLQDDEDFTSRPKGPLH
mgnify:CR=1 FL=1|jgi:hypothetical protein